MSKCIFFLLLISICLAAIDNEHKLCKHHFPGGIPPKAYHIPKPESVVGLCKNGFLAIEYNTFIRTPLWVSYKLTSTNMKRAEGGRRKFTLDEDLLSHNFPQASPSSPCFNQVFTRGHLAPSRAFSWNKAPGGPHESVYTMANIAPQIGRFNSGSWNQMETKVFNFVKNHPEGFELYVVTGVSFNSTYSTRYDIGVPSYFYHVMCDLKNGKSAGFYARNSEISESTKEVQIWRTVKEVGEHMHVDFKFPAACRPDYVNPSDWWNK